MWAKSETEQKSFMWYNQTRAHGRNYIFIAKNKVFFIFTSNILRFVHIMFLYTYLVFAFAGLLCLVIWMTNVNIDLVSQLEELLDLTPTHGFWFLCNRFIIPTRPIIQRTAESPFGFTLSWRLNLRVMLCNHMEDRELHGLCIITGPVRYATNIYAYPGGTNYIASHYLPLYYILQLMPFIHEGSR